MSAVEKARVGQCGSARKLEAKKLISWSENQIKIRGNHGSSSNLHVSISFLGCLVDTNLLAEN